MDFFGAIYPDANPLSPRTAPLLEIFIDLKHLDLSSSNSALAYLSEQAASRRMHR
jgi:hypothetical protein